MLEAAKLWIQKQIDKGVQTEERKCGNCGKTVIHVYSGRKGEQVLWTCSNCCSTRTS
jgi:transposase-like protein